MKYLQYYKNSDADSHPEDLVLKSLKIQGNSEIYFLDMQGECNVDAMSICVRYEFSIFSNNFVSFVISFHPRALLTYAIKFGTFLFFL